ncbi:hypothetical protein TSAR_003936 [Trichomalopsis sarcophagae]|uniref:Uncharacterized protein n=1 Tax=Trichomalopsis sarcophagae TaxID=543379 RepID=A0A232FJC0_9HYME|nr:hypothetical protein TSAR_003936 [Trichomalopsis sarcophagae]
MIEAPEKHPEVRMYFIKKVQTFSSMLSIWMTNSIANSGDGTPAIFSVVFVITGLRKKCRMKLLIPIFFHGLRGPRSSVILIRGFEGFSEVLKCVKEIRNGRASSFTIWESVIGDFELVASEEQHRQSPRASSPRDSSCGFIQLVVVRRKSISPSAERKFLIKVLRSSEVREGNEEWKSVIVYDLEIRDSRVSRCATTKPSNTCYGKIIRESTVIKKDDRNTGEASGSLNVLHQKSDRDNKETHLFLYNEECEPKHRIINLPGVVDSVDPRIDAGHGLGEHSRQHAGERRYQFAEKRSCVGVSKLPILPISEGSDHRHDGIWRPGAHEQEEDRKGHLGDPHLDTSLLVLGRERFDVHLLRLGRTPKSQNQALSYYGQKSKPYLLAEHLLVSSDGLDQLRVEVDDQYHRKAVGPGENRGDEYFSVLVVAEEVEAAGRQKSLCNSRAKSQLDSIHVLIDYIRIDDYR